MQRFIRRTPRHNVLFSLFAAALVGCASFSSNQVQSDRAKNIILFIGDGMGVSTVTAARIFDGQSQGKSGEEHVLPFERFDNVALVKTYNTNQQVADSAGTA
ncbi:MAG: alkaline phosphatase, partial [Gammaproteobacteria bacterium]|nr:alkaline phosphatase [Gammaproteobacteria bacterium]